MEMSNNVPRVSAETKRQLILEAIHSARETLFRIHNEETVKVREYNNLLKLGLDGKGEVEFYTAPNPPSLEEILSAADVLYDKIYSTMYDQK